MNTDSRMRDSVIVLVVTIVLTIALFEYQENTTQQANAQTLTWPCHYIFQEDANFEKYSTKFASPIDFFSHVTAPMVQIVCSSAGGANVYIQSENKDLHIYKFAYERDEKEKKWRKITLSGQKTNGPWIVGSASAGLEHVPTNKRGLGQVLVYTCQEVSGVWKCGCSEKSCKNAKWQIQTYALENNQPDHEPTDDPEGEEPTRPYDDVMDDDYLSVYGVNKTIAFPGQIITGGGGGLAEGISVHFDSAATVKAYVLNNNKFTFVVPNIEPGVYKMWFTKGDMRSRNYMFTVKNIRPKGLTISKVEPDILHSNTTVTIQGSGFDRENNVIFLGLFKFSGVPSADGTSLSFNLVPDRWTEDDIPQEAYAYVPKRYFDAVFEMEKMPSTPKEVSLPLTVVNSNGQSNQLNVWYK